jgi:hypothetical protein
LIYRPSEDIGTSVVAKTTGVGVGLVPDRVVVTATSAGLRVDETVFAGAGTMDVDSEGGAAIYPEKNSNANTTTAVMPAAVAMRSHGVSTALCPRLLIQIHSLALLVRCMSQNQEILSDTPGNPG